MPGYSANSLSPERNMPRMVRVCETACNVAVVSTTTWALTGSMAMSAAPSASCVLRMVDVVQPAVEDSSHSPQVEHLFHAIKLWVGSKLSCLQANFGSTFLEGLLLCGERSCEVAYKREHPAAVDDFSVEGGRHEQESLGQVVDRSLAGGPGGDVMHQCSCLVMESNGGTSRDALQVQSA